MVLVTDWESFGASEVSCSLKGAFLVSGVYDLQPIRLSSVNAPLQLTEKVLNFFLVIFYNGSDQIICF